MSYRLAFVVSMFFEYGGMQRSLLRIARECQHRGHEVHLYTGELRGTPPADIELHMLDARALSNTASNDRLAAAFATAVAGQGYDCLVGFTKLPGLDVYYAGDPCYAARVDADRGWWYKWLPRYHALLRQEAAVFGPHSNAEILLFAHQEQEKFRHYYATDAARFHLLPPGINRERLLSHRPGVDDGIELKAELGMRAEERMILLVGAFFGTKGVDRAIRALAALPEVLRNVSWLVVVGDDDAAPYTRLANELGIASQVVFAGGREDIARFYFAADSLVHPAYTENTGTAILEAMVCGLPVLATANCGFAFHIEAADAGLVCPQPFEQKIFNRQLEELLMSDQRDDWRENAVNYCQQHDLYSLIERAADVIIERAAANATMGSAP
jgi:UDP-glucose:(heptosyl)LPS alpha-1,3-glucosyltransferase